MDGRGVTEGDTIKVGSNAPAKIISINYVTNTITVNRSLTWASGDGVHWRNPDGSPDIGAYEDSANVTVGPVVPIAPSITTQPSSQTVPEDQTISFRVGASGSNPMTYQWRKGSTPLSNGGNISGATAATLTLSNVTLTDAGSYQPFKTIYNPRKDGDLEIHYTAPGPVTVSINDRKGREVRVIEGSSTYAEWDGKNKSGEVVAAGTYQLIIRSGDKAETKKIVVVKSKGIFLDVAVMTIVGRVVRFR